DDMVAVFWVSCAIVAYVYAGYPALVALWARRQRRLPAVAGPPVRPPVSIVVAVRDEEARLAARLDNPLELEYPAPRQIIVVSDGSVDETIAVLARYQPAVEVVSIDRGGKAAALNAGVARAKHEILVFADARQTFAPDALLELTAPFADPRVGA